MVAILPEYAVDIFFAYSAGSRPEYAAFATANMTGANRLLIGVAWPLLVFAAIWALRRRARAKAGTPAEPTGWLRGGVTLAPHRRVELVFLAAATVYALVIPLTRQLAWYDTIVLGGLFGAYLWRIRGSAESEEELTGVAATVATQPRTRRRILVTLRFAAAAVVILAAAEPFGEALVDAGGELGIDRFLLVQWLAPIASEAPEVLVAITFALRGRADDGMGALLAAKLNQRKATTAVRSDQRDYGAVFPLRTAVAVPRRGTRSNGVSSRVMSACTVCYTWSGRRPTWVAVDTEAVGAWHDPQIRHVDQPTPA
ncbi:hypothetical protein ACWEVP_35200 [Amycolatopsis sp. NPDC003865]